MIAYVEHEMRLNRTLPDGTTERANLEVALDRYGSAVARRLLLDGPQCPDHLRYLLEHATALVGRSGVGMDGAAPLTWSTLKDYQSETGWSFAPWEKEMIMAIDAALRHRPDDLTKNDRTQDAASKESAHVGNRRMPA
jgi:hypothetical protein